MALSQNAQCGITLALLCPFLILILASSWWFTKLYPRLRLRGLNLIAIAAEKTGLLSTESFKEFAKALELAHEDCRERPAEVKEFMQHAAEAARILLKLDEPALCMLKISHIRARARFEAAVSRQSPYAWEWLKEEDVFANMIVDMSRENRHYLAGEWGQVTEADLNELLDFHVRVSKLIKRLRELLKAGSIIYCSLITGFSDRVKVLALEALKLDGFVIRQNWDKTGKYWEIAAASSMPVAP